MEYRESRKASHKFWELFGQLMAALHHTTHEIFGFKEDNYFDSLRPYDDNCETASQFFVLQRLMPQFKMASDKEDVFKEPDSLVLRLEQLIEFAALIRGDLRLINYLVNLENKPCFIGLAVAYPLSEIDQVLMRLYKGFDDRLSSAYNKAFQLKPDWQKRIKL